MSKKKTDKTKNHQNQGENNSAKDQVEEAIDQAIDNVEENSGKEGEDADFSEADKLKEDVQKEKDKFLRLFAEFENYKRRTSKERLELFKTANQEVMSAMLPVLDDFDRALNEIQKTEDKNLLKGVELIHNKLRETLKSKGLEPVNVEKGDNFDADLHEAITQIPAPSEELKGKIVDVVERGYKLGERIIRYPKVVTGK
ncbi:nucleotide exchange factor GrpE [Salegentibacter sp.]|uniref:nucleotide exchange factor GrpE n=1 Tax=Salegentibacter sp. TaxID=1903072 RepID=UPI0035686CB9